MVIAPGMVDVRRPRRDADGVFARAGADADANANAGANRGRAATAAGAGAACRRTGDGPLRSGRTLWSPTENVPARKDILSDSL